MSLSPNKIFGIVLGLYFAAILVPPALSNIFNANTTGWDAGTIALWGLIPLAVIAVIIYRYMPGGGKKAE